MSNTVDNLFITKWQEEVSHVFQQTESRLRQNVKVVTGVGESFSFPRMEAATSQKNKARHADLVAANVASDRVAVTINTYHAAEYVDDLDQVRTNTELRAAYTQSLMAAINRNVDQEVITAMSATANSALSVSNTLNKAGLITANKTFLNNEIHPDGMWNAVISPGGQEDILSDTTLTSRDFIEKGLLDDGYAKGVMGWNLITSLELDSDTAGKTNNYFFHKNAVGLAFAKDVTMSVDWIAHKDAWQVMAKVACGAVIIRPEGVQYAEIDN
jgi:hypothetical protein